MTEKKTKTKPAEAAAESEAPESWPPRAVVVYQDGRNAPAVIVRANEDHTLDLLADLHEIGHPLTLFGVARRQGSGNGWEPAEA